MGASARATKEIKKKDLQSQLDTQAMSIFYIGRNVYNCVNRLESVISLLIKKGIFTEEELNKEIEENRKEFETQMQKEREEDIEKVIEESKENKTEGDNNNEENN